MQKYGIILNGKLLLSDEPLDNYKPVQYAPIPDSFDQATQYVIQADPVDNGDIISMGIEVKELPPQDEQQPDIL